MAMDPSALEREMTAWRRDLHAHPEFGFEETRTSAFVAAKLREFGLDEVAEGVGGTGVIGTLRRGSGNRAIALRADMDALRVTEQGTQDYRSQNPGTMHACGHDGHTAMLCRGADRSPLQRSHVVTTWSRPRSPGFAEPAPRDRAPRGATAGSGAAVRSSRDRDAPPSHTSRGSCRTA